MTTEVSWRLEKIKPSPGFLSTVVITGQKNHKQPKQKSKEERERKHYKYEYLPRVDV